MAGNHLVNPSLLDMAMSKVKQAANKRAFVPAPAGGDAGGGMPPGGAGGGMPPGAGGGMPPGGGGGDPIDAIQPMIQQAVQQAMASQGGGQAGGQGGVEPIKPKVDTDVSMMRIEKMLAKLMDAMGIQMPAAEMVATSDDMTQYAMQQDQVGGGAGAPQAGGPAQQSAIQPPSPIEPMQQASPAAASAEKSGAFGRPYDGDSFSNQLDRVNAIYRMQQLKGRK